MSRAEFCAVVEATGDTEEDEDAVRRMVAGLVQARVRVMIVHPPRQASTGVVITANALRQQYRSLVSCPDSLLQAVVNAGVHTKLIVVCRSADHTAAQVVKCGETGLSVRERHLGAYRGVMVGPGLQNVAGSLYVALPGPPIAWKSSVLADRLTDDHPMSDREAMRWAGLGGLLVVVVEALVLAAVLLTRLIFTGLF